MNCLCLLPVSAKTNALVSQVKFIRWNTTLSALRKAEKLYRKVPVTFMSGNLCSVDESPKASMAMQCTAKVPGTFRAEMFLHWCEHMKIITYSEGNVNWEWRGRESLYMRDSESVMVWVCKSVSVWAYECVCTVYFGTSNTENKLILNDPFIFGACSFKNVINTIYFLKHCASDIYGHLKTQAITVSSYYSGSVMSSSHHLVFFQEFPPTKFCMHFRSPPF
jgi:hypothetical protein